VRLHLFVCADNTDQLVFYLGATYCSSKSFRYAGVEYSNECYCSNSIKSTYVTTPDYECNMPCAGDGTQLCGAGWRIQVRASCSGMFLAKTDCESSLQVYQFTSTS
jgi:hypothetical protein